MPQVYAVIMAGGVGSRFWPRSREKSPKQLLEIVGKGTMIQNTVARIADIIPARNTYVVTNKVQKAKLIKQLPQVPDEQILVEPIGRNTAPCIGLASLFIKKHDPNAVMVVLPADHVMGNEPEFRRIISLAVDVAAESGGLVTIGIKPDRPETGYGYIQVIDDHDEQNPFFDRGAYRVKTFAEKPNVETAHKFLASGDFLWNSGMFVWRVDAIMAEIERQLPEMYDQLSRIGEAIDGREYEHVLEEVYHIIRGISIDYGVMEKANSVYVIKGDFGWSDVGSWDEVYRISGKDDNGNTVNGRNFLRNTNNSIIYAGDKFVAAIDVDDLIIVVSDDAVLVCKRGQSQDVKEVVDYLRRKQHNEFL